MTDLSLFKRSAALTLFSFSLVLGASAEEAVLDGVAAVVQGSGAPKAAVITFSQMRELAGVREKALRDSGVQGAELVNKIKEIRTAAINDLIDRQLILQEFEKNKFNVPEYVIDEHVQTIIREDFNKDRNAFLRTLSAQGYTPDKFRQLEREKIIVQAMRQKSVRTDVTVPPKKVEEYYAKHREEFSTEDQIKLRMIVLKKDESESGVTRKTMEEIRQKIVSGGNFGELAKMYSQDTTAENEGDWGWIDKRTLNESLTRTAFKLKTGQVSDIIEMAGNFYLLFVEARKNAVTKSLGEVREDIVNKLSQEERQKLQQKWIESLRKKAYIKIF